jgi:hypothetical protein
VRELDVPGVCLVRRLVKRYLDVQGTPRRVFFERLSLFADGENREKLLELASPQGADLFHEVRPLTRRKGRGRKGLWGAFIGTLEAALKCVSVLRSTAREKSGPISRSSETSPPCDLHWTASSS